MRRKPKTHAHSLSSLTSKRAELMGDIEILQGKIKSIRLDIEALDRTIVLFDPKFDMNTVKSRKTRKTNTFFKHGQMSTRLIDLLREAGEPMNTNEITESLARSAGLNLEEIDRDAFRGSVAASLKI